MMSGGGPRDERRGERRAERAGGAGAPESELTTDSALPAGDTRA